jgi:hypothetical protein
VRIVTFVRLDLNQLRHHTKNLLRVVSRGDPEVLDESKQRHPNASRLDLSVRRDIGAPGEC